MSYILKNTTSLQLANGDGETLEFDDFQQVGEYEVTSRRSFKEDDETIEQKLRADSNGHTSTVCVEYTSGDEGLQVQEVHVIDIPEGYELETLPNFEFLEVDDNE